MKAITVAGVSKRYRIGTRLEPYGTLRDSIARAVRSPLTILQRRRFPESTIWALDDVSFDIAEGELVGIIGRNGAGKSTLLKILSRITEPTRGTVELRGRVASLLEVGTGFHYELTGRENIFLSSAILGMRREETRRRFDEIVAFADMEKFIDTPVKHYSSGMYTRLAFAIAAHLQPEILLVDEVLAVGDAVFQKKCLDKLEDVGSQGRTVLFVSHQVPMVLRLCQRVLLFQAGRLVADGDPHDITRRYLHPDGDDPAERVWPDPATAPGDHVARLKRVRVLDESERSVSVIDIRRPFTIEMEYRCLESRVRPTAVFQLLNEDRICLFATNEFSSPAWQTKPLAPGTVTARCHIPGNFLAEGTISVQAAVRSYNPDVLHASQSDVVSFQVIDRSDGDGVRRGFAGRYPGVLRPAIDWTVRHDPC